MSRAIFVSLAAAIITLALTVAIAAIIDYAWVYGSSAPNRFAALGWAYIFGLPFVAIQFFIPAIIVGVAAGIFSKIWLRRERRIRSLAAAAITFALTVVMAVITSYVWVHGSSGSSRDDNTALMIIIVFWPALISPLFIPAIIVGIVAGVFPRYGRIRLSGDRC